MTQLVTETEHFSRRELACRCGVCDDGMDDVFMANLERLRVAFGRPMVVTSGHRCPDHNKRVASTGRDGPHTHRRAVDVQVARGEAYHLVRIALGQGTFSGIGLKQHGMGRFVHLDDLPAAPGRPRPTVWTYD